MKKKFKSQEGITLIALVITIIVMLILVAVTINMAINGGLFNYAGRAVGDMQNAIDMENEIASGRIEVGETLYNSIDDYLDDNPLVLSYEETAKDENGILKANATYTIEGEGTAVVPKGFKVIAGTDGKISITNGLVIQDVEENEFVWIPVTFTLGEDSIKDENGLYPEFLAVFYRSDWSFDGSRGKSFVNSTSYTEPYASGYTNPEGKTEVEEYYEMMRSVQENGGFYIGRYEAGSQDEEGTPIARTNTENGTSKKVVVKRDQYPYTYVGWGLEINDYRSDITYSNKNQGKGALYLSKQMYDGKDVGVTSTLCYGVQWDAMLDFIKSEKHVTHSGGWGNYEDNAWKITSTTAKYTTSPSSEASWTAVSAEGKTKTSTESILLTTGASDNFSTKNIYDVAGNVWEWTNEADSSIYRIVRGGSYNYPGYYIFDSRKWLD